MTGLEPHPILELPPAEWANDARRIPDVEDWIWERRKRILAERQDPLNGGFEPVIWGVVDDLLCDGHRVILDVSRLQAIGAKGPIVPLEMEGHSEVWIAGSNRSSKSEYAAKKVMKILGNNPRARTWSFADTGPISKARQQPLFWKYMPAEVKRLASATGKVRRGPVLKISYSQAGGFTEETFVLQNGAQHWFKNYEQDPGNVEGDQLDAVWLDELRNLDLLKTLRGRMGDRSGLVIVTFTSIDENYSAVVNEYERGAVTKLEVDAELLPIKRPRELPAELNLTAVPVLAEPLSPSRAAKAELSQVSSEARESTENCDRTGVEKSSMADSRGGGQSISTPNVERRTPNVEWEVVGYKKVPRIKIAGRGSDGHQRANIVYFHISDNPYYGYEDALRQFQRTGKLVRFGKERFYRLYEGATENKIKSRVYGLLAGRSAQQFPKFNDLWHVIEPEAIPTGGTNYHVVDPCEGRNWFMLWIRITARGWWYVYREWPSHGHAGAYIPGIGDPDAWTLPGQPADGVKGPAQDAFGFGLDRYKQEILRVEGHPEQLQIANSKLQIEGQSDQTWWRRVAKRPAILHRREQPPAASPVYGPEEISERWMDCRYGNSPTVTREGRTTLLEQMDEIGMTFLSAPAEGQIIGNETGSVHLINDVLDYDEEVERGKYSPRLARLNEPKLYVSRNCPNLIYSLREWTGKDKGHGACKDPIDCLRYALLAGLEHLGEDAYRWQGGGSY